MSNYYTVIGDLTNVRVEGCFWFLTYLASKYLRNYRNIPTHAVELGEIPSKKTAMAT